MAEKNKAEVEFATMSKKIQQRKLEVGRAGPNVQDEQLAGAVAVLEESDKKRGIGTSTDKRQTVEELQKEKREERVRESRDILLSRFSHATCFNHARCFSHAACFSNTRLLRIAIQLMSASL